MALLAAFAFCSSRIVTASCREDPRHSAVHSHTSTIGTSRCSINSVEPWPSSRVSSQSEPHHALQSIPLPFPSLSDSRYAHPHLLLLLVLLRSRCGSPSSSSSDGRPHSTQHDRQVPPRGLLVLLDKLLVLVVLVLVWIRFLVARAVSQAWQLKCRW